MKTPRYVCSKCGGERVTVNESRPSLDDRYAVGWCESCTPVPTIDPKHPDRTKPLVRAVVPLVREDVWNPDAIKERRRLASESRLLKNYRTGNRKLSDAEKDRAEGILARYSQEAAARRVVG